MSVVNNFKFVDLWKSWIFLATYILYTSKDWNCFKTKLALLVHKCTLSYRQSDTHSVYFSVLDSYLWEAPVNQKTTVFFLIPISTIFLQQLQREITKIAENTGPAMDTEAQGYHQILPHEPQKETSLYYYSYISWNTNINGMKSCYLT